MLGVIVFTVFVLCILLWTGTLGLIVFGLLRLAIWLITVAVQVGLVTFGTLAWCVMFCFGPSKALAALRGVPHTPNVRRADVLTPAEENPYRHLLYTSYRGDRPNGRRRAPQT